MCLQADASTLASMEAPVRSRVAAVRSLDPRVPLAVLFLPETYSGNAMPYFSSLFSAWTLGKVSHEDADAACHVFSRQGAGKQVAALFSSSIFGFINLRPK